MPHVRLSALRVRSPQVQKEASMITELSDGGGNVMGVTCVAPDDLLKGAIVGITFHIRAGAPTDAVVAR